MTCIFPLSHFHISTLFYVQQGGEDAKELLDFLTSKRLKETKAKLWQIRKIFS